MQGFVKLPKKHLYLILVFSSLVIFMSSLEVIVKVKDIEHYKNWLQLIDVVGEDPQSYQLYVSLQLAHFFSKIIIPMIFALYTYVVYLKIRLNNLYIFMWAILLIGALAYNVFGKPLSHPALYAYILAYGVLLLTVLSLTDVMREQINK
jgi:hypothetical protein